jgi:H+/Cl- antiporter ClcA
MSLNALKQLITTTRQEGWTWALFSTLALVTIAVTILFVYGYSAVFHWCEVFAKRTAGESPLLHVLLTPLCFLFGAGICWKFVPHAVGNGVSKVREAISKFGQPDSEIEPYLGGKQIVVKSIASCIAVLGGGALGREGPVVHLSAALFWLFGRHVQRWIPKFDLQHWVIGGSAAGFAVAFHAPVAGLIFAIEELYDTYLVHGKLMTLWLVLLACVTQGLILPMTPLFAFIPMNHEWQSQLVLILLVAVLCGVGSSILMLTSEKVQAYVQKRFSFWAVALVCGLVVGIIGALLGGKTFGGGVITIQQAMAVPEPVIHLRELIGRLLNTFLSVLSGNAGGLLGPSVVLGASIGSVIGDWFQLVDVRLLMACGMAAFLSGLMSIPLTAAVLVFETTGQSGFLLAYFVAAMVGHLASGTVRTLFKQSFRE